MKQIDLLPVKVYPEGTDIEALYKEKQAELLLLTEKLAYLQMSALPHEYLNLAEKWKTALLEVYSLKTTLELRKPVKITYEDGVNEVSGLFGKR